MDTDPVSFTLLPGEQFAALTGQARAAYDEARLDYHSELVVVTTSAVRQVIRRAAC